MKTNASEVWDEFWKGRKGFLYRFLKTSLTKSVVFSLKGYEGRILEAGCGEAWVLDRLQGKRSVTGLDFSKNACKLAKNRIQQVVNGNIYHMPFKGVFDVVFNQGVVQADSDSERVLNEMVKTVRVGGSVVFTVPKKNSIFHIIENVKDFLPFKWPSDQIYWNEKEVMELAQKFSKNVTIKSIWFKQLLLVEMVV